MVKEHTSNNLRKDSLCRTSNTCIVQQVAGFVFISCKEIARQPTHGRVLVEASFGLKHLHSFKHSAKLVLPSATCSQHLLQCRGTSSYLTLVPRQAAEVIQRTKHGGCKNAARTESATCRNSRQQCQFYTAAESLKLFLQRGMLLYGICRQEACESKSCLRYGERTAYMTEVGKFLISVYHFRGSEVDTTEYHMRLFTRTDICLQRRLTVKFYRKVYNLSAFHKTVWRSVGPSASYINTHRTACPHYLVGIYRHLRMLLYGSLRCYQSLTEQGKSLLFRPCRLFAVGTQTGKFGAEHIVVDTCQQRCFITYRRRCGDVIQREFLGCITQVYLIEHAVVPVLCYGTPVLSTVFIALHRQADEVCLCRNIIGTKLSAFFPQSLCLTEVLIRHSLVSVQHPAKKKSSLIDSLAYREDSSGLQVLFTVDCFYVDATGGSPFLKRTSHI